MGHPNGAECMRLKDDAARAWVPFAGVVALLLGASALACSGAPSPSPVPVTQGGSGGVSPVSGGDAGIASVAAGASGAAIGGGGASPDASGSAGTGGLAGGGTSGAGGAGGTASAGKGGSGGGTAGMGGSGGASGAGWVPLFNGMNLDGWTPSPGAADIFAVSQLDGEGVIHVYPTQPDQSDQPQATLRTNDSYSSYVYHVEYKWGTNRFADRKQTDRDNGLCFHICNDPTQVWPESIEFQFGSQAWPGDWVAGNIFMLVDKTRAMWPSTMMNGQEVFSAGGMKTSIGAPNSYERALAPAQLNKNDDWNIIELTVHGSKDAEYNVNGTVVNQVFDMECNVGGTWQPLDHGPIALQAEFAEVYFRNVRIMMLQPQ
jgi:hypothetical protein